MAIKGFDYQGIANNFAQQSMALLNQTDENPDPDFPSSDAVKAFSQEDKQYVVDIVKKFCLMAGSALNNDPKVNFTAEQASILTQLIGEWTFHKAIDLITVKIPPEQRDVVLQNIAMNIFNSAQQALLNNLPTQNLLNLIEEKVNKIYNEELQKLVKKGVIDEKKYEVALNTSNFNEMVQKNEDAASIENVNGVGVGLSSNDKKILKLVTLAIVLKKLPQEDGEYILKSLDKKDVTHVLNYMKMPNLENKIDHQVIIKTLEEIRSLIPPKNGVNVQKLMRKYYKFMANVPPKKLQKIAKNEREAVQSLILDKNFPAGDIFPPYVLQSLVKSIEEKVNDN